MVVHAEGGEGAVGVDDVEVDGSLSGGRVGGAIEEGGFDQRDAIEAPGGVGEFLRELGFGGGGGLVFIEELAAVALVGCGVLSSENGGAAGEAVRLGVAGRTLFAGGGAGSGGAECIGPICGGAVGGSTVGGGRGIGELGVAVAGVCHECLRCGFSMRAGRFGGAGGGCCWVGGEDWGGGGVNGEGAASGG